MDCFLADGLEVIFRLALALLKQGRNALLLQDMGDACCLSVLTILVNVESEYDEDLQ